MRRLLEAARTASGAFPHHAEFWALRGRFAERTGAHKECEEAWIRALTLAPNAAGYHVGLSYALSAQGRHEAALGKLVFAIGLAPELGHIRHSQGLALLALGRVAEAIDALHAAAEREPAHYPIRESLARCYEAVGDFAAAADALQAAIDLGGPDSLQRRRDALAARAGESANTKERMA